MLLFSTPSYALWGSWGGCYTTWVHIDDVAYNVGLVCDNDLDEADLAFLYDVPASEIPRDSSGSHFGSSSAILKRHKITSVSRRHMGDKNVVCGSLDAAKKGAAHQAIADYLGPRYAFAMRDRRTLANGHTMPSEVFDVYFKDGHQIFFLTSVSSLGVEDWGICRKN